MNEWAFEVPEELFRTFASDPTGPLDKLLLATNDPSCAFYADSNRLLDAIPLGAISETCKDETFLLFHGEAKDYDRPARIWFAERFLIDEISRRKLRLIKEGDSEVRPVPYYFSACSDIEVGDDHLAKLSQFEFDGARLIHNESAFTILLPLLFTNNSPASLGRKCSLAKYVRSGASSCGGIGRSALLASDLHALTFRVTLSTDCRTRMILRSKSKSDTRNAIPSPILNPSMKTIAHSVANGSFAATMMRPDSVAV
jgi:hypothetical protein